MHDTLVLPSILTKMADARVWAAGHARAAGYDDDAVNAVSLALTESLSNVIRHRFHGEGDHEMRVELDADPERIVLLIHDWGDFDPSKYTPRDLDVPRAGGYGIHLIKTLMDEVRREPDGDGDSELALVRYHDRSRAH